MKSTLLITCNNSVEAALIKGNLANEGIECMATNERYTSLYPNMSGLGSGIRILVDEADVERAMQVIQGDDWKIHCPKCKSADVLFEKTGTLRFIKNIIKAFVTITPFENMKAKYSCNECGNKFEI